MDYVAAKKYFLNADLKIFREDVSVLSRPVTVTPWIGACQAPISMEFSRQNTGVGCHFLLQGFVPDPGIEPESLVSPALAGRFFTTELPGKPLRG